MVRLYGCIITVCRRLEGWKGMEPSLTGVRALRRTRSGEFQTPPAVRMAGWGCSPPPDKPDSTSDGQLQHEAWQVNHCACKQKKQRFSINASFAARSRCLSCPLICIWYRRDRVETISHQLSLQCLLVSWFCPSLRDLGQSTSEGQCPGVDPRPTAGAR